MNRTLNLNYPNCKANLLRKHTMQGATWKYIHNFPIYSNFLNISFCLKSVVENHLYHIHQKKNHVHFLVNLRYSGYLNTVFTISPDRKKIPTSTDK